MGMKNYITRFHYGRNDAIYNHIVQMLCLKQRRRFIMKLRTKSSLFVLLGILVSFFFTSYSSAFPKPLKTALASPSEVKGAFTLILYGGNYLDDIETIAILDSEGDEYTLEPYAPAFDFKVQKGVPAEEALETARKFVSFHPAFWRSQLSKILDERGNTIGYEVRPLYMPTALGMMGDVLDVYYWPKKGGRVKVVIKLVPSLERYKFGNGGGISGGGGGL
jgi:hypothetical protein